MNNAEAFSHKFSEDPTPDLMKREAELIAAMDLAESAKRLLENPAAGASFKLSWNLSVHRMLFTPIDPQNPDKSWALIKQARLELDSLQAMFNTVAGIFENGKEVATEIRDLQNAGKRRGCLLYTSPSPRDS